MNVASWFRQAGSRVGRLSAELLLSEVLGVGRAGLHAHPERELSEVELEGVEKLLVRRERGEPMAYILGRKEFFGREFEVNGAVLVPRPETEVLVDLVRELKPQRILDVGTGSGVIAVSLALELPDTEVVGCDISEEALAVARQNAERLGAKVSFMLADLFKAVNGQDCGKYDVIVANLPYVDESWEWNGAELKYEPRGALYAGDGGLEVIKRLVAEAPEYLSRGGYLVLEADESQHEEIKRFTGAGGWELVRVLGLGLVLRGK
jgi:release factor glutamine methyltransferase